MGLLRSLDRGGYIALRLVIVSVRIAWACSFGILLAGFYVAAAVCLSPFWTIFGGAGSNVTQTALNIWLLTPGKDR